MWRAALALLVALGLSGPAAAAPFEAALAVHDSGDYATAVSLFRMAAEQGLFPTPSTTSL
jgi:hypothetical protein